MFAETFTFAGDRYNPNICKIEVGLSQGIPIIKYFGDVSTQYMRSRDKIPFIFSYLGRKAPKKKIRVNFSSKSNVTSSSTDLAVITGIYLATNNIDTKEKIHCLGEVFMNGEITNSKDLESYLYLLSNGENKDLLIFIPQGDENLLSLYPDLNLVVVKNISEVIGYFEGSWEPRIFTSQAGEEVSISSILESAAKLNPIIALSISLGMNILYLGSDQKGFKPLETFYQILHVDSTQNRKVRRVKLILQEGGLADTLLRIDNLQSCELLTNLLDLGNPKGNYPLLLDERLYRGDCIKEVPPLLSLKGVQYLMKVNLCQCKANLSQGEGCICSSKEVYKRKELIKRLCRKSDLIVSRETVHYLEVEGSTKKLLLKYLKRNISEGMRKWDGSFQSNLNGMKKEIREPLRQKIVRNNQRVIEIL